MSEAKISEVAVESALSASAGSWQVRDMLACDESEHAEVMGIALTAALPHLHPQPAELADLYRHLLDMLGAKSHEDAGRIIGELHGKSLSCTCPSGDGSLRWPCPKHPPESAELPEQQGRAYRLWPELDRLVVDAYKAGTEGSKFDLLAARKILISALAATGKQQVGEVQGDARAQFEEFARDKGWNLCRKANSDDYGFAVASAGWASWQAALAARQPGAQVPRADLVPGIVRCAKCAFQLARTTLYMGSGTVGAGDSKTEPCPNGCGPLWPVTWETWAREGWAEAERLHMEKAAAPPAQGIDLGDSASVPLSVLRALSDMPPETNYNDNGYDWLSCPTCSACADFRNDKPLPELVHKADCAVAFAKRLLADGQRDAAPGVGNGN